MKKFLLACSLLGAIATAHAQPAQTAPDHPMGGMGAHMMMREHAFDPAEHAAQMQKALQLSDEQTAKVKKVLETETQQRKALDDKYKPQFEAFHTDMKNLHEQTQTQLNGILTPKQQQALEAQYKHKGHGEMCPRDKDSDEHMHAHGENTPAK